MERSESIVNLSKALVKAMSEMGAAKKDSNNPFFKSKYADLNSLREAALPALHENGITILQPPTNVDGVDYINTIIQHTSGEYMSSLNRVVIGVKKDDPQAFLAAQTYTRRGAFQSFLCMGSDDDDGNGISGRSVTKVNNSESKEQDKPQTEAPKGRFSRNK